MARSDQTASTQAATNCRPARAALLLLLGCSDSHRNSPGPPTAGAGARRRRQPVPSARTELPAAGAAGKELAGRGGSAGRKRGQREAREPRRPACRWSAQRSSTTTAACSTSTPASTSTRMASTASTDAKSCRVALNVTAFSFERSMCWEPWVKVMDCYKRQPYACPCEGRAVHPSDVPHEPDPAGVRDRTRRVPGLRVRGLRTGRDAAGHDHVHGRARLLRPVPPATRHQRLLHRVRHGGGSDDQLPDPMQRTARRAVQLHLHRQQPRVDRQHDRTERHGVWSRLQRRRTADRRRNVHRDHRLLRGVGRTTATAGRADEPVRLHRRSHAQRPCRLRGRSRGRVRHGRGPLPAIPVQLFGGFPM